MSTIDALKSLHFSYEPQAYMRLVRSWQDGGGGPKGPGSVHDYPQTDGQLIRAMRIEDNSSFFDYIRMKPLRVRPRIQESDTNYRRALEPGLEFGQNAKSVAEAWQKRQG